MINNAREAHQEGLVWVEVKINGGNVPVTSKPGSQPVGTLSMKGPMSSGMAFILWMAAKGLTPAQIQAEYDKVYGENADSKLCQASHQGTRCTHQAPHPGQKHRAGFLEWR